MATSKGANKPVNVALLKKGARRMGQQSSLVPCAKCSMLLIRFTIEPPLARNLHSITIRESYGGFRAHISTSHWIWCPSLAHTSTSSEHQGWIR